MRPPLPAPAMKILMFGPPVGLCVLIWWLSGQPKPPAPEMNDKVAHVLAYALLTALWVRAFWFASDLGLLGGGFAGFALGVGYGVVDELHQSFVPGRVASALDVAADGAGALLGALLTTGLYALTQGMARRGGV